MTPQTKRLRSDHPNPHPAPHQVRLLWPQTKAGVVKLRQRTCLVQFRRKPGGGSPRGRAYVLLVERRSGAPPRERPVSWRSLASRSLEVLSSPRAPPIGPWTSAPWSARERAAARARLDAGEEVASVALSLGRSEASTRDEQVTVKVTVEVEEVEAAEAEVEVVEEEVEVVEEEECHEYVACWRGALGQHRCMLPFGHPGACLPPPHMEATRAQERTRKRSVSDLHRPGHA